MTQMQMETNKMEKSAWADFYIDEVTNLTDISIDHIKQIRCENETRVICRTEFNDSFGKKKYGNNYSSYRKIT